MFMVTFHDIMTYLGHMLSNTIFFVNFDNVTKALRGTSKYGGKFQNVSSSQTSNSFYLNCLRLKNYLLYFPLIIISIKQLESF